MSRGLAERVVALARSTAPRLGSTRLVCVDGPAGSGKTTLAAHIQAVAPTSAVLHVDDMLAGWGGLATVHEHVQALLGDLAQDRPGTWRRYDWPTDAYAEEHTVEPTELLVLEGCGSGGLGWAPWTSVLVWVEATPEVRLRRGMERDGEEMRAHWVQWMADEEELFTREKTRGRADLVIPT